MSAIFYNYVIAFFYPFKIQKIFFSRRNYEISKWEGRMELFPLNFVEAMGVSWILKIIMGLYFVIGIKLQLVSFDAFDGLKSTIGTSPFASMLSGPQTAIWGVVLSTVFFPVSLWIYIKIYEITIKFFVDIFKCEYVTNGSGEEKLDSTVKQVVNVAISSYLFLLLPVIGDFLSSIYFFILLFAGLKHNLKFSFMQSLLVMIAPFILVVGLIVAFGTIFSLLMALVLSA